MSLFYIVFSVMIIYRNTKLLHTYDKDKVILHTSEERLGAFGGCMFDRTHISLFLVIDAINNDAELSFTFPLVSCHSQTETKWRRNEDPNRHTCIFSSDHLSSNFCFQFLRSKLAACPLSPLK